MTTPTDRVDQPKHLRRRFFLSSTSRDLAAHRAAVIQMLRDMGQDAIVMEHMGAWDADATTASLAELRAADVYLGLLAWRYGYVPVGETRSVTHLEYTTARDMAMPRLLLLADESTERQDGDGALFPEAQRDPEHHEQLLSLRREWERARVVSYFTTPDDLAKRVAAAIHRYLLAEQQRLLLAGVGLQPPRDLPSRVPGFVGRECELADLCANLRTGQATEVSAAVAGLGGVGKSALASEAMRLLATEPGAFPGGITFVRCDGRAGLEGLAWIEQRLLDAWELELSPEQLARAALGAEAEVEVKEQALHRRLRSLLQSRTTVAASQAGATSSQAASTGLPSGLTPALVLLDNVEPGLPVDRLLHLLREIGVTALVTARQVLSLPHVRTQQLKTLARDAAHTLFSERYISACQSVGTPVTFTTENDVTTAEAIDALTKLLGSLPLAIELAATRAGRLGLSPSEAAQELQQAQRRGELLADPLDPTKSLAAVLDKSLTALTERQRLRFAALALPQGADWPRATIEVFLTKVRVPEEKNEISEAGTISLASRGNRRGRAQDEQTDTNARAGMRADLDALVSLSLVSVVLENASGSQRGPRLRMHPLLRERALREWEQWLMYHPKLRVHGASALVQAVDQTLIPYAKQPHTYPQLDAEEALLVGALTTLAGVDNHSDTQRLVVEAVENLGSYLQVGGRWRLGSRLVDLLLTSQRLIGDRKGEGKALSQLGKLAHQQGRVQEARRLLEQALAIAREVGDQVGEQATLNSLGRLADWRGQVKEARRYFEEAQAIAREVGDRGGEATALHNLGSLTVSYGRVEEAWRYFEEALAIAREVGNRSEERMALSSLGYLAQQRGQLDEAANYYEQALAIAHEVEDRLGERMSLDNLGRLAERRGQSEEARGYFEEALAIAREVGDRAGQQAMLSSLGHVAQQRGQLEEARRCFEETLAIAREVGNHMRERMALRNLGRLAGDAGQMEEAGRYLKEALAITRAAYHRAASQPDGSQ